jgi:hypothetical protein
MTTHSLVKKFWRSSGIPLAPQMIQADLQELAPKQNVSVSALPITTRVLIHHRNAWNADVKFQSSSWQPNFP